VRTSSYIHTDHNDEIVAKVRSMPEGSSKTGEPYVVLSIGDLTLYPSIGQLIALKVACDQAVADMRAAITQKWNDEHPEQPHAIGPGHCESCNLDAPMLFERRIPYGDDDRITLNVCSTCAGIDADALARLTAAA
jgi:hypothetical protein